MADISEIYDRVIFDSSCQAIVNTVNCVGVMGAGLALEFKNRFPKMFEVYQDLCRRDQLHPGILHLYKRSKPWILNFPTKIHWRYPSKYEYIIIGLEKFTLFYREKQITSIAFPQLGTSAGGLEGDKVRDIMLEHLQHLSDLNIELYHYNNSVKDSLFDEMKSRIEMLTKSDFAKITGLNLKQADAIIRVVRLPSSSNMNVFHNVNGIGKNAIQKLYKFAMSHIDHDSFEKGEQIELFV